MAEIGPGTLQGRHGRRVSPPDPGAGSELFAWVDAGPAVIRGFTQRAGGVSEGAYASLNLGSRVADDPAAVVGNRAALASALGIGVDRLVFVHQVHGNGVAVLDALPRVEPEADALVTTRPGLALVVLAADCVPVLLADPAAGVIGAAHVGRPGMVAGTVAAVVAAMREAGADAIDAAVGPAVCGACYEVPQAMYDAATAVVPQARAVSATGTPALDIAAGVLAQLSAAGVRAQHVLGCTRESENFFSYRRDPRTGRHAGVIVIREDA